MLEREFVDYALNIPQKKVRKSYSLDEIEEKITKILSDYVLLKKKLHEISTRKKVSIVELADEKSMLIKRKLSLQSRKALPKISDLLVYLTNPAINDSDFDRAYKVTVSALRELFTFDGRYEPFARGKSLSKLQHDLPNKSRDEVNFLIKNIIWSVCFVRAFGNSFEFLEKLVTNPVIKEHWNRYHSIITYTLPNEWPIKYKKQMELLNKQGYSTLIDKPLCRDFGDNESTPLHAAVTEGKVDVVEKLIELRANVNVKRDFWEETPLFSASYPYYENNEKIITLLLQQHADPRIPDRYGALPWENALRSGKVSFKTVLQLRSAVTELEIKEKLNELLEAKEAKSAELTPSVEVKEISSSLKSGFFSMASLEHKLSKEAIELKTGIGQCNIPLPFSMITTGYERLSGASPYRNSLEGWEQFCKDLERINHSLFLLFNEQVLSEKLKLLKAKWLLAKEQITSIIAKMQSDIAYHLKPEWQDEQKQLNDEFDRFIRNVPQLLMPYFRHHIAPELMQLLGIKTTDQLSLFLWNYTQNLFSDGIMLLAPCLRGMLDDYNKKQSDDKKFDFVMTGANKIISNIHFSQDGSMEVMALAKNIYVKVSDAQADPGQIEFISPRPQLVVKLKSTSRQDELPYDVLKTNSLELAREFFMAFCSHQAAIHKASSSLDIKSQKTPDSFKLSSTFKADVKKSESHRLLENIYSSFLRFPLTEEDLVQVLNFFSKFQASPHAIDQYFIFLLGDFQDSVIFINATLQSLNKGAIHENKLDLRSYKEDQRNAILNVFSKILKSQRLPTCRLEGGFLLFDAITLSGIRELMTMNAIMYKKIQTYLRETIVSNPSLQMR